MGLNFSNSSGLLAYWLVIIPSPPCQAAKAPAMTGFAFQLGEQGIVEVAQCGFGRAVEREPLDLHTRSEPSPSKE